MGEQYRSQKCGVRGNVDTQATNRTVHRKMVVAVLGS